MSRKAELTRMQIQRTAPEAPQRRLIVGLDVHKETVSYCVKDTGGVVNSEGKIGATPRRCAN